MHANLRQNAAVLGLSGVNDSLLRVLVHGCRIARGSLILSVPTIRRMGCCKPSRDDAQSPKVETWLYPALSPRAKSSRRCAKPAPASRTRRDAKDLEVVGVGTRSEFWRLGVSLPPFCYMNFRRSSHFEGPRSHRANMLILNHFGITINGGCRLPRQEG